MMSTRENPARPCPIHGETLCDCHEDDVAVLKARVVAAERASEMWKRQAETEVRLAMHDKEALQAALRDAEATIREQENKLEFETSDYQRMNQLRTQGLARIAELEAKLRAAEGVVRAATKLVKNTGARVGNYEVAVMRTQLQDLDLALAAIRQERL